MDKDVPRGESNIHVYYLQNSIAEDLAKFSTALKIPARRKCGRQHGGSAESYNTVISKECSGCPGQGHQYLLSWPT